MIGCVCSYDCVRRNQYSWQDDVKRQLIGCVVLTRYNNKTYRIDDVAFEMTPESEFEMFDGSTVTFCDYYR